MSARRPHFARFLAAVLMTGMALVTLTPSAQAAGPEDVCAAFPHRQTYVRDSGLFQAPAWHFNRTVTVVYEAASCVVTPGESDDYVLAIVGVATIYEGSSAKGDPLRVRPFTSTVRSNDTDGKLGWPISWWSCFEGSFSYVWSIEDVYIFAVTGEDGRWAMTQRDPRSGDSLTQAGYACRRSLAE